MSMSDPPGRIGFILRSGRTRQELVSPAEVHEALKLAYGVPRASQKFRLRRAVLSAYSPGHGGTSVPATRSASCAASDAPPDAEGWWTSFSS